MSEGFSFCPGAYFHMRPLLSNIKSVVIYLKRESEKERDQNEYEHDLNTFDVQLGRGYSTVYRSVRCTITCIFMYVSL